MIKRLVALCVLLTPYGLADESGFRPIFNGKTLDGWNAPDSRYWSVQDGAITGKSSAEVPCTQNQFLVWEGGIVDDFELELKYRILGTPRANSGIQIRSEIAADGHASGYQADFDRAGRWRGALYDEKTGRRILARPGQKTVIARDGKRTSTSLGGAAPTVEADGWNRYHVSARGSRIVLMVNGVVTADVVDEQVGERDLWGRLALQLHSGPPMTVQFKDIRLKRLPLSDERKKIVLIAGKPSHASGEHEFNAGVKLLAKRFERRDEVVVAPYHDGWPGDPTAFDNASAIVLYSDGGSRHPFLPHLDTVDALMKKGVGLMCMHYAVEVPADTAGEHFKRWIGGHYEHLYSSNPHWLADVVLAERHPITRGTTGEKIHDEWYYNIRFREGMKGITSIIRATPSDQTRARNGYPPRPYPHIIAASGREETLMWAVERPDGGRGVGFTGGHWHRNWAYASQRDLVLNAMLWVAGVEVPEKGVQSAAVSESELNQNLDAKRTMKKVALPERH